MNSRKRSSVRLLLVLGILLGMIDARAALAAGGRLTILNFANGDTITYDLPLLVGEAANDTSLTIRIGAEVIHVAVNDGQWRTFVPLVVGRNTLQFTTSTGERYTFDLVLAPASMSNSVRLVYLIGSDSDGAFDAPVGAPHGPENGTTRLRLAGRMLQSLTAELLHDKGLSRSTFRLMADASGVAVVEAIRSTKTRAELRSMTDMDLYFHFYDLLADFPNRNHVKDLAILAETHYDAATETLKGHLALGGDRLPIFGSATLYTFPERVGEIEAHFTDPSLVEPYLFPEYGRSRQYWAAFTTSIGAMLHEVGHSFGLPHPDAPQPQDLMYRGFDYLNRMVVTTEPGHGSIDSTGDIMPRWTDSDAVTLQANDWFGTAEEHTGSGGPRFLSQLVMVDSPHELHFLAEENVTSTQGASLPLRFTWPEATWSIELELGDLKALNATPISGVDGDSLAVTATIGALPKGDYHGKIMVHPQLNGVDGVTGVIDIHFIVARDFTRLFLPLAYR